jgi:hypothetical protein
VRLVGHDLGPGGLWGPVQGRHIIGPACVGGGAVRNSGATKTCVFRFLCSLILKNNIAFNTHSGPTPLFSAKRPRTEHWPRATETLTLPVVVNTSPNLRLPQKAENFTHQLNYYHLLKKGSPLLR